MHTQISRPMVSRAWLHNPRLDAPHAAIDAARDEPKSLARPEVRRGRLERLHEPHVTELTRFVEFTRAACGREDIPYFDPCDGGVGARALFLLEAPGPQAIASGFVSRNNPDETAKNWLLAHEAVGIPRTTTILWNIVPWYLGTDGKIRSARRADILEGTPHLQQLIPMLPQLKAIVLVGGRAQTLRRWLQQTQKLAILATPHPSPQFVNRRPGNRQRLHDALFSVARFLLGDTTEIA